MTCAAMGGPAECTTVISGETAEEMAANGTAHVMASHPDIAAQMGSMSEEEKAEWTAKHNEAFAALPEVAAE